MSGRSLTSVRNAARVLKEFSRDRPELGVSELSRCLGLTKSTVHRLLTTLTEEHLLIKNTGTGRYRLGLAAFDLGSTMVTALDLHAALAPAMNWLQKMTGSTVTAGVLDGREVVIIERVDSPQMLRLFLSVSWRQPANLVATGKVLLAHLDPLSLDQLLDGWQMEQRTTHSISNAEQLRRHLRLVRRRGHALNDEEARLGVGSIAAPIRDGNNIVVASIAVVDEESKLRPRLPRVRESLERAATLASRRLEQRTHKSPH